MKPFFDAFTLLTIVPVPFVRNHESAPSRFAPLFFPLVGLLVGLVAAAVFALGDEFLPRNLAATLAVVTLVAITGGLHVDGLSDFADGIFGGRDPESRLRIMKQPDIGAFGVTAVILALLVDWTAITSFTPTNAWTVLPIAGLVSRSAPLIVMTFTSYVSSGGLGQSYVHVPKFALLIMLAVVLVVAFALGGPFAIGVAVSGLVIAGLVGLLAKSRIGGSNGDVYGASIELAVPVCLIAAVAIIDSGEVFESIWTTI